MFQKQIKDSEPTSIDPGMMLAQGNHRAEHRLHQPLQLVPSNNTGSATQAGLSMHYLKAYPQILAFKNSQSIARDLLGPSTPPRLDKRILIVYQLHHPESRYHAWWNPAMIYVSHAVLTSSTDPEWRFYFVLCLKAYRTLSIAYPFAAIGYKALLTLAMAEGKLSADQTRKLLKQLFHGKGRENVRHTRNSRVYMDLNKIQDKDDSGNAEALADDFEKLAVVKEFTYL